MLQIVIAKDFTEFPGPRYRVDGPKSGEEFRETVLEPKLRRAIAAGEVLSVVLDGVAGFGSSFLEESFGGLVRRGLSANDMSHLRIVAQSDRFQHHRLNAEQYIRDALARERAA